MSEELREKLKAHPYAQPLRPFKYEEDALAIANTAKTLGEWMLQGRGTTIPFYPSRPRQQIDSLSTLSDSPEAAVWNKSDKLVFALSDQERNELVDELLPPFLKFRKNHVLSENPMRFKITEDDPEAKIVLLKEVNNGPLQELDAIIRFWPAPLQDHATQLVTLDLWQSFSHMGKNAFFTSPFETHALFEGADKEAKRVHVPLPVALSILSAPEAYDAIGMKKGIPAAFKKKLQTSRDDWVFFATAYEAFTRNPAAIDTILRAARTMYAHFPSRSDEYQEIAAGVLYNAVRAGIDIGTLKPNARVAERSTSRTRAWYTLQKTLDEHFDALGEKLRDTHRESYDRSQAVLDALITFDHAVQEYVVDFDDPLTRMSDEGDGLLSLRDGRHMAGLERAVYGKDLLGKGLRGRIRSLMHSAQNALLDNVEPYVGLLPGFVTERVQALHQTSDAVVRNHRVGKGIVIYGGWKLLRNLPTIWWNAADGEAFYTLSKLRKQIVRQGSDPTQWPALWEDLTERKLIPDNPPYGSVELRPRTEKVFSHLLPPQLPHHERTLRRDRSILLNTEYPRDEYHIPTTIALGAISARLGLVSKAEFFLGSAEYQSQKAVKDGTCPAPTFEIQAKYERSLLKGENEGELREQLLIEAFAEYGKNKECMSQPKNDSVEHLLAHITSHPLDYESKLSLIRRLSTAADLPASLERTLLGKEDIITRLATSSYHELATLLRREGTLAKLGYSLSSQDRQQYVRLQHAFQQALVPGGSSHEQGVLQYRAPFPRKGEAVSDVLDILTRQ